jgi:acetylglutamate kinase
VLQRYFLDYQAVGHHIISHGQGVGVAHINLVLADSHLVMRFVNGNTEHNLILELFTREGVGTMISLR